MPKQLIIGIEKESIPNDDSPNLDGLESTNIVDNLQKDTTWKKDPADTIEIHIFRAGKHTSQSGFTKTFSNEELDQVCETHDPNIHTVPLIMGHDEYDDGQRACGWCEDVYRRGSDLYAKICLTGYGKRELDEGNFRRVSARFYPPDEGSNPYPGMLSLRHVALVTVPAIKGLEQFSENNNGLYSFSEDLNYKTLSFIASEKDMKDMDEESSQTDAQKEVLESIKKLVGEMQLDNPEESQVDPEVEPMELAESKKECWDGYERVPGTKAGEEGSCRKKGEDYSEDSDEAVDEDEAFKKRKKKEAELEKEAYDKGVGDVRPDDDASLTPPGKEDTPAQKIESPDVPPSSIRSFELDGMEDRESDKEDKGRVGNYDEVDPYAQRTDDKKKYDDSPVDSKKAQDEYKKILKDEKNKDERESISGKSKSGKMKHLLDEILKKESQKRAKEEAPESNIYSEKAVKKEEDIVIPPALAPVPTRLADQSYSEAVVAKMSIDELHQKRRKWQSYSENLYNKGILVESIIPQEDLFNTLMFLDNQTQDLSFSEGQKNPLEVIQSLLSNLPNTVSLGGFEPDNTNVDKTYESFPDNPLEDAGSGLIYSEQNPEIAFTSDSFNLHKQALQYAEKNGVSFDLAVSKILEKL